MEINKIKALDKPITVAVYKKSIKARTHYMLVTVKHIDILNNKKATKPLIDHKYEIIELGVGLSFIENWKAKYKIKKYTFVN
jgi:hypothetical protein